MLGAEVLPGHRRTGDVKVQGELVLGLLRRYRERKDWPTMPCVDGAGKSCSQRFEAAYVHNLDSGLGGLRAFGGAVRETIDACSQITGRPELGAAVTLFLSVPAFLALGSEFSGRRGDHRPPWDCRKLCDKCEPE